jgi:hypothetical protein
MSNHEKTVTLCEACVITATGSLTYNYLLDALLDAVPLSKLEGWNIGLLPGEYEDGDDASPSHLPFFGCDCHGCDTAYYGERYYYAAVSA